MLPVVSGEFRVVADPELRFTPTGMAVATVRVVANRKKKNEESGEWEDAATCWASLKVFKRAAENVAESLQKGDLVVVTGRLETDDWEDKDGNKRTTSVIMCDSLGPALQWNPAPPMRAQRDTAPRPDPWSSPAPEAVSAAATDDPPF